MISAQQRRFVTLYHQSALRVIWAIQLKKGAGLALTRLAALRHNNSVRECVHDDKVLAQPMMSE